MVVGLPWRRKATIIIHLRQLVLFPFAGSSAKSRKYSPEKGNNALVMHFPVGKIHFDRVEINVCG